MIALYCETHDMRLRIEGSLVGADLKTTESREAFREAMGDASVGIAEVRECSDADVAWLRTVFGQTLTGPSCIIVAPLSLARLRRLRRVESSRFHVVWAEEAGDRLLSVLDRVEPWHRDPLRLLGHRLLCNCSLHWSMVKAIKYICNLSDDPSTRTPKNSVTDVARDASIPADAFRRYWKTEVPLRCSPKQLLSWKVLLWAVRQRSEAKWDTIAGRAGVRRRTLERHSRRLAGCTLAVASRDPELVERRFEEWLTEVSALKPRDVPNPSQALRIQHQDRSVFSEFQAIQSAQDAAGWYQ